MWQRSANYCPLCGRAALADQPLEGRERRRCLECGFVLYENPASAAAGAVIDADGRVLLIRRAIPPFQGDWALPAGYQEIDEDPRTTALREIREETGIHAEISELLDVIFVPYDQRKPANVIVYLCRPVGGALRAAGDASDAAWFDLDDLPANIGFDNAELVLGPLARRRLARAQRPGAEGER